MKNIIAIDMGATSIRICLAKFNNNNLKIDELLRFYHKRKMKDGRSRWDFDLIKSNIINVIKEYGHMVDSIAVDTWGVDFAYLDNEGELINNPISYRDDKNVLGYEYAKKYLSDEEIYLYTGNQIMSINTLFQLLALREFGKEEFDRVDKLLLLPDYINYLLCGNMYMEESILSTSQLLDISKKDFSKKILETYDISESLFSKTIKSGHIIGNTKNSRIKELREFDIDIISIPSHDTACAGMMTDALISEKTLFLSCGTWSLLGCFLDEAIILKESFEKQITNEIGYDSRIMFLKNITGLYLIEKLKDKIEEIKGEKIEFDYISKYVQDNISIKQYIDVEEAEFAKDDYDIIEEINNYLTKTNQDIPQNIMDYFTIIYTSLVNKYNEVKKDLEDITGRKFDCIHIIGGGSKSELLCNLIKEKLGVNLKKGYTESTLLGNIVTQLIALGEIKDLSETKNININ